MNVTQVIHLQTRWKGNLPRFSKPHECPDEPCTTPTRGIDGELRKCEDLLAMRSFCSTGRGLPVEVPQGFDALLYRGRVVRPMIVGGASNRDGAAIHATKSSIAVKIGRGIFPILRDEVDPVATKRILLLVDDDPLSSGPRPTTRSCAASKTHSLRKGSGSPLRPFSPRIFREDIAEADFKAGPFQRGRSEGARTEHRLGAPNRLGRRWSP